MTKHLMLIATLLGVVLTGVSAQETASPPPATTVPIPQTENKPDLQFYPSQSIEIQGLLDEGESFSSYLLISSNRKIELSAKFKPLKDDVQFTFLRSESLSVTPNQLSIEAGKNTELSFTVMGGDEIEPGNYTGELELTEESGLDVILQRFELG